MKPSRRRGHGPERHGQILGQRGVVWGRLPHRRSVSMKLCSSMTSPRRAAKRFSSKRSATPSERLPALVLVAGPMPRPRESDGTVALRAFPCLVERDMRRQDERTGGAQLQPVGDRDPALLEPSISFSSDGRCTTTPLPMTQATPGRGCPTESVEDGLLTADDQGVTGVVPALETDDGSARSVGDRRSCPCLHRPTGYR